MSLSLPLLHRYPHFVKFKSSSENAGIIAAMTGTGQGVIVFLPATGATGATGTATPAQAHSLFEFISIDPLQVDDYAGTITMTNSAISAT